MFKGFRGLRFVLLVRGGGFLFRLEGSWFPVPLGLHLLESWGSRVAGFGFRVEGLGFRVEGLGLRVRGLGFRVEGLVPGSKSLPFR